MESVILTDYCFSLCSQGSCSMRISGRSYTFGKDCLLVLCPNQLVEYGDFKEGFKERRVTLPLDAILDFPSPVDTDIMNFPMTTPMVHITEEDRMLLNSFLDFIDSWKSRSEGSYREEIVRTLLYAFVLEVCELFKKVSAEISNVERPRPERLTDDFFKLLSRHFRSEHQIGFYARQLHRTPKYLSSAILRVSGRSAREWINSSLIAEIKLQLRTTDRSILEISEELGFSSPSVFVQFFRRHTGTTPLQYRKQG